MEDGSLLEHHRQPPEPLRDGLPLLRLLLNIFASMPITDAVSSIEVRLGEITSAPPRQLSLFNEPAPVHSLEQIAPKWAHKHRHACFYRLALTGDEHLPERAIEKQKVTAG